MPETPTLRRPNRKTRKNPIYTNPPKRRGALGQSSIRPDYIRHNLITRGGLRHPIEEDGLKGMTSNPSMFIMAIAESHLYNEDTRAMATQVKNAMPNYEIICPSNVQSTAKSSDRPCASLKSRFPGYAPTGGVRVAYGQTVRRSCAGVLHVQKHPV